jgi:DNA-damage-inducible protein D
MEESIVPYYFDTEKPAFEESYHENGQIYWYASSFVVDMLGYDHYSPTMTPVQKALQVCMSTNIDTSENFREEYRTIDGKRIKDFKLSRFACYLVAMNADIKKTRVAEAQAYFAAFAACVQEYIRSQEDIERVSLRTEITDHEKTLNATAKVHGVVRYDYFQNSGYLGLYNMPIQRIRALKGIPDRGPLFDYMGAEELGANIFRITQTEAKIKRENIRGQGPLEAAAKEMGRVVRNAIAEAGGTMPENLPAQEDIKHIKSDLKKTNRQFTKSDKRLVTKKTTDSDFDFSPESSDDNS